MFELIQFKLVNFIVNSVLNNIRYKILKKNRYKYYKYKIQLFYLKYISAY